MKSRQPRATEQQTSRRQISAGATGLAGALLVADRSLARAATGEEAAFRFVQAEARTAYSAILPMRMSPSSRSAPFAKPSSCSRSRGPRAGLHYTVRPIEGDTLAVVKQFAAFIDVIGISATPFSATGLRRRAFRRAVLYCRGRRCRSFTFANTSEKPTC
mgnify:CR=1 FL=1